MLKKPWKTKALDLAGWRKSQVVTTKAGTRSMTQKELAQKVGCGNSLICRIESGERWPSTRMWEVICAAIPYRLLPGDGWNSLMRAQLRTWRAYSPDRKGMTP